MRTPATELSLVDGLSGGFVAHLEAIAPRGGAALDLGTGTGRVALRLAPTAKRVVAVDIDPYALEAGRAAAARAGITNIEFIQGDAETMDLRRVGGEEGVTLTTMHLFLSLAAIANAAKALTPGGHLLASGLSDHHWQEAGGSRFNLGPDEVTKAVSAAGLEPLDLRYEESVSTWSSADEARTALKDRRLWAKWRGDGRWDTWRAASRKGWRLTESRLLLLARRAIT